MVKMKPFEAFDRLIGYMEKRLVFKIKKILVNLEYKMVAFPAQISYSFFTNRLMVISIL